jgi:hypothetical protein
MFEYLSTSNNYFYTCDFSDLFSDIVCENCNSIIPIETLDDILDHCRMCKLIRKQCLYKCYACTYQTKFRNDMRRHIRGLHTGDLPYKCSHCDFKSVKKSNLEIHVRKHTGEKPYECGFCIFTTSCSKSLNRHIKNRHTLHTIQSL